MPVLNSSTSSYAAVAAVDLTAKKFSGRIDIYSENLKFDLTEVKSNSLVQFADWLPKKDQKKHWVLHMGLLTKEQMKGANKWQELKIEFIPSESGFVTMEFKGPYYSDIKVNHHEIWVDDVKVEGEGVSIQNGSFEEIDSQGKPIGWVWPDSSKDRISTDGSQAHIGKVCILVWQDKPIVQKIPVKAWKKYKVSAWFKSYYK